MPKIKASPIHVLVVEDVDEMREMLSALFESIEGVQCRSVGSTWEARLEVGRHRPDIVFLDEVLPGESSLDWLNEIVSDQIAVYLMTGMEDRNLPLPQGVLQRLYKPTWESFDQAKVDFEAWVHKALGHRKD